MEQLHLLYVSDPDMQKITAIMTSVANIRSPSDAISWALDHASIPRKKGPSQVVWKPVDSSLPPPFIDLPTGTHKLALYKIDVGGLAQLDTHVIVGADALEKISLAPTHCALVSKVSGLGL